jgi:hypothetical protein
MQFMIIDMQICIKPKLTRGFILSVHLLSINYYLVLMLFFDVSDNYCFLWEYFLIHCIYISSVFKILYLLQYSNLSSAVWKNKGCLYTYIGIQFSWRVNAINLTASSHSYYARECSPLYLNIHMYSCWIDLSVSRYFNHVRYWKSKHPYGMR